MQEERDVFTLHRSDEDLGVFLDSLTSELGEWADFRKSMRKSETRPLRKLFGKTCLFWGFPTASIIHQPVVAQLLQVKWKASDTDPAFVEAANGYCKSVDEQTSLRGIQGVAWANALPQLTYHLEEEMWVKLLAALIIRLDASPHPHSVNSSSAQFIHEVEIPLALSYRLSMLPAAKQLRKMARARFEALLDAFLDGEGTPQARHLGDVQILLASCVRSLRLDAEMKGRVSKAGQTQFDWLTRQTIRWSRPNGSPMLSGCDDSPYFDELIKAALTVTEDESDAAANKSLRGKRLSADERDVVPATSEHSEWSEVATMRASWEPRSPWFSIRYNDGDCCLELGTAGRTILTGNCTTKVTVDGKTLEPTDEWYDVCWESDKDVDYLELECKLEGDWKIQRQILLARDDLFLFYADAVLGPVHGHLQYQHTFPLADQIVLEQSEENTEATIQSDRRLGQILPLAFSEWKSAQGKDRFRLDPFRLEREVVGSAVYAPVFINLDPSRCNRALTWRQLTVAENLLSVSKDTAVAYRVQIGKEQWVFYRSLAKPGNRTFLGLNLLSDFYAARFHNDGETHLLIHVEPDE